MVARRFLYSFVTFVSLLGLVLTGAGRTSAASDPGVACAVAKQKAAFKLAASIGKCLVEATKTSSPVDNGCEAKATMKLDAAFAKAESKGGCLTTNDASSIASMVNNFASSIVFATVPPANPCGGSTPNCAGTCPTGQTCGGFGGGQGSPCHCG